MWKAFQPKNTCYDTDQSRSRRHLAALQTFGRRFVSRQGADVPDGWLRASLVPTGGYVSYMPPGALPAYTL